MRKPIGWLLAEVDQWLREGIIDARQAGLLRERYAAEKTRSWATSIFSTLGALLFGCGVILLFAYNWERMPKLAKLGVVFVSLLGAHGTGLLLKRPGARHEALGEALHVLGTMLFGAGIWLVAQIYHIEEHFPNAFLVWGLAALAMGWALRSVSHGIISGVLFVLWNGFEVGQFRSATPFAPPLILLALAPLAGSLRSRVLTGVAAAAVLVSSMFSVALLDDDLVVTVLFSEACLLLALALIVRKHDRFPESAGALSLFGNLTYWTILALLTFPSALGSVLDPVNFRNPTAAAYFFVTGLSALAAWVLVLWPPARLRWHLSTFLRADHLVVPAALVLFLPQAGWLDGLGWVGAGAFNLLFLTQCFLVIHRGSSTANLRLTASGCILFSFLAAARYTDIFTSLITRSLVFLVVGALVFSVGVMYSRARKRPAAEQP